MPAWPGCCHPTRDVINYHAGGVTHGAGRGLSPRKLEALCAVSTAAAPARTRTDFEPRLGQRSVDSVDNVADVENAETAER
jgi:hypothetical protein